MFLCFDNGCLQQYDALPDGSIVAGLLDVRELEKLAPVLGFSPSTVRQCHEEMRYFRSSIEVYDTYSFATVKRTRGGAAGEDCSALYIRKGLFLVIDIRDSDGSTKRQFKAATGRFSPTSVTLEKLIFAFLDTLIEGDAKLLEDMEFALSKPEERILQGHDEEGFTAFLLSERRKLLMLRNYYEQLIDIGRALEENENDLFAEEDLRYFKVFTDKAERLERNVRSLREQLMQLREAHQAMLDLHQNNIMKIFTVLSAVFLPLTLITGWYGMNFQYMPELAWRYGYLYVFGLAAAVLLFCIALFRRHRWL